MASGHRPSLDVFFKPGEAQPPFAGAPLDPALAQRITKLVEFACRNGPSFIALARQKQAGNPEYAFLEGGVGADYYRWYLYASLRGIDPQTAPAAPGLGSVQSVPPLPVEDECQWAAILESLTGSRDSIRSGQKWFTAHQHQACQLAAMLEQQLLGCNNATRQLHLLWLANDILFKAQAIRGSQGEDGDAIALAFRPMLGRMLRQAFVTGGQTEESQAPLVKMVNLWAERGVYSQATAESFSLEMLTGQGAASSVRGNEKQPSSVHSPLLQFTPGAGAHIPPPGSGPPPANAPWHIPSQERYVSQAAYAGSGPSISHPPAPAWGGAAPSAHGVVRPPVLTVVPPAAQAAVLASPQPWQSHAHPWATTAGGPHVGPGLTHLQPPMQSEAPPPPPAAPPLEPEEEPFDPMSFPPGLIPKLVEEGMQINPPYTPISIEAIEEAGVPPPPEMDAYLKARLDKFYAQVADYREGMQFADLEIDLPRRRTFNDSGREEPQAMPAAPLNDGSGPRGVSGAVGLGYASQRKEGHAGKEDVFSQYRDRRSGVYFDLIHRNAAKRGG